MDMSRHVSLLLFCSLLMAVRGLDNCLPSRAAYVNLSLGNAEDVPVDFTSGTSNSLSLDDDEIVIEKGVYSCQPGETHGCLVLCGSVYCLLSRHNGCYCEGFLIISLFEKTSID